MPEMCDFGHVARKTKCFAENDNVQLMGNPCDLLQFCFEWNQFLGFEDEMISFDIRRFSAKYSFIHGKDRETWS